MGSQRIFFEYGGPLDGDSGERGNDPGEDGGVVSIKPFADGERAVKDTFNRPPENLRRRTEVLRSEGEDAKYRLDADLRFLIWSGNADGVGIGEPIPGITWNKTTGIFVVSDPLVIQPINTPASDVYETKDYDFDDGITTGGTISFLPLRPGKYAYNSANLIRIKWLEATPAELSGAVIPGSCDAVVSGDPDHILTITIRNDNLTPLSDIELALTAIEVGQLDPAGIDWSSSGDNATKAEYGDIPVDDRDYYLKGTADRELHYIPPAVFATFFAGNSLSDGDTLSIYFPALVEESGTDGRRQRIPSNFNTTVIDAELFITTTHPEWIPYSLPLCKRIGDDLLWIDGTVILGTQSNAPLAFGEHGITVNRIADAFQNWTVPITGQWYDVGSPPAWVPTSILGSFNNIINDLARAVVPLSGADLVGKKQLTSGTGDQSANPLWFGGPYSIGDWLDGMLGILNKKPSLTGSAESIHNIWNFLTKIKLSGANASFIEGGDADTWTGDTVKLFESLPFGGSGPAIRVYYSQNAVRLCINCNYNGTTGQYARDVATPYRSMVIHITDRLIYFKNKHYTEASPWTDSDWTTSLHWDSYEGHAYFSNGGDASDYVRAGLYGKEYHGSASVFLFDGEAITWHARIGNIDASDVYAYEDDNSNWDTSTTATVDLDHVDPWGCWIYGHSNAVGAYAIAQWVGWIEVYHI